MEETPKPKRKGTPRKGPRKPRILQTDTSNVMARVREAKGLTQEKMAELLGCNVNTVRRCEYENRLPTSQAVLKALKLAAQGTDIVVE